MKLLNTLKFRFILLFILFIILICVVMSFFAIRGTKASISKVFAQQGTTIAENAAALIDGDAFERLTQTLDAGDPFYEATQLALLEIKQGTGSRYLYTMAPQEGDIYRFIIDGSTTPDDAENFSALGDEEDTSDYNSAFEQCWAEQRTVASGIQYQGEWGWVVSIYTPIFNSRGTMVGLLGCDYNADEINGELEAHKTRQIIMTLFFIFVGLCLMFFFVRLIFGRLAGINSILKEISEGEGDLTRRIENLRDDEIGELGRYFNETLEKIKYLVAAIKEQSSSLSGIGSELSENMNETTADIELIAGSIQNMKKEVLNQAAGVTETNATMDKVSKKIDRLNTNVEIQTTSVSQSSSAVEEMLANIQGVTNTLMKNVENVNELTAASEVGRAGLEGVSQDIQEIARESEGLLEINSVMENIASQTNLLSMNAAIEAAHAGEAGRGFAVVAGEIRKLAVSSSDQSKIISGVLRKIKTAIDKITKSTSTVLQEFLAINTQIRIVSEQEANIRSAMEDQGQGSQRILESISRLNELTHQVKDDSDEMLEGSKEVIYESKNLETATQKVSEEINEIAAGADHINSSVSRVNELSRANKKHIDTLMTEVSKFKVD